MSNTLRRTLRVLPAVLAMLITSQSLAQVLTGQASQATPVPRSSATDVQGYVVFDLGTLGGNESRAYGISNSGLVVGWAQRSGGRRSAFLWNGSQMSDLGVLPGDRQSMALGVNNAGQVVGESWPGNAAVDPPFFNDYATAFSYTNGTMVSLGTLGGADSRATAVSDAGVIVGVSALPNHDRHAFAFVDTGMTDLGTLGGFDSDAGDVTNFGLIVGYSDLPGYASVACRWVGGEPHAMGGLAHADGVNDYEQAAGRTLHDGHYIAAVWDDGNVTLLGTLGGRWSGANAINDSGQVVGQSEMPSYARHAFVYENGQLADLNALVADPSWLLENATDINDSGEIVGYGTHNGVQRAFLAVPPGLRIHGPTPGFAGVTNSVMVLGAQAGDAVYLYYGVNPGTTNLACGETIEIDNPVVVAGVADAQGVAHFVLPLPVESSGQFLRLQAFAPADCEVSRLMIHVVP